MINISSSFKSNIPSFDLGDEGAPLVSGKEDPDFKAEINQAAFLFQPPVIAQMAQAGGVKNIELKAVTPQVELNEKEAPPVAGDGISLVKFLDLQKNLHKELQKELQKNVQIDKQIDKQIDTGPHMDMDMDMEEVKIIPYPSVLPVITFDKSPEPVLVDRRILSYQDKVPVPVSEVELDQQSHLLELKELPKIKQSLNHLEVLPKNIKEMKIEASAKKLVPSVEGVKELEVHDQKVQMEQRFPKMIHPSEVSDPISGSLKIQPFSISQNTQNTQNTQTPKWIRSQTNSLEHEFSGGDFVSTLNLVKVGALEAAPPDDLDGSKNNLQEDQGVIIEDQKKGKVDGKNLKFHEEIMDSKKLAALYLEPAPVPQAKVEIPAQVVTGSNAKERLSTDALMGVRSEIRLVSNQGGGEIRVRLKPENLGELNVRVITDGSRVGLQIHASDEKSKKIIEESIGHLKESLSAQNLTLSTVDIIVNQRSEAQNSSPSGFESRGFQGQSPFQDALGQNGSQKHQNQWDGQPTESAPRSELSKFRSEVPRVLNSAQSVKSRLDVRA